MVSRASKKMLYKASNVTQLILKCLPNMQEALGSILSTRINQAWCAHLYLQHLGGGGW